MGRLRRVIVAGMGWVCFGLGWAGIFLPGLPTTIFWILAALAFLRTNDRAYAKVLSNRRFGPSVKLFVEEGKISPRGKAISIGAMIGFASIGALAIPPAWAKVLVVGCAAFGSVWVAVLPTPYAQYVRGRLAEGAKRGDLCSEAFCKPVNRIISKED